MANIPLAEAIADLRSELAQAMQNAGQEAIRFGLGPVELEFELAVTKEGGAGAKAKFWVLELSADGKLAHARTHRLKLVLEPETAEGDRLRISSARRRRRDEPLDAPDSDED